MSSPLHEFKSNDDFKDDIQMTENIDSKVDETETTIDLVSNYDNLTKQQALRKFWHLFLVGMLVASAGL
jgi:hypothetical protein